MVTAGLNDIEANFIPNQNTPKKVKAIAEAMKYHTRTVVVSIVSQGNSTTHIRPDVMRSVNARTEFHTNWNVLPI
jgi:hypothetical protein